MGVESSNPLHVIVGAGAVGAGTAQELANRGLRVRVITRSGSGPEDPNIERVAADATDVERLTELTAGAHALYNAANPPYAKWGKEWPPLHDAMLTAAEQTGARLVIMSNLYGYGTATSPMRSTDPLDPPSKKGKIRADMWNSTLRAHQDGRIRAVEVRASDFFGPGIGQSHLGDMVIPRVLAGKNVSVVGAPDQPHSWTFIGDVARTLATVGTNDDSLGRAWHVPTLPPLTAQQLVDHIADAAGTGPVRVKQIPRAGLMFAGLFVPDARELREMLYQFDAPFVIDASDTEETFGLAPTPLEEQVRLTIESYGLVSA